MRAYFQQFLTDVKNARKDRADFAFNVKFLDIPDYMHLSLEDMNPDYITFRPFIRKEARNDFKGNPFVTTYDKIIAIEYLGELK